MALLTVRENIYFSASLRLPSSMSREEKTEKVDKLIDELGLSKVANSKVCLCLSCQILIIKVLVHASRLDLRASRLDSRASRPDLRASRLNLRESRLDLRASRLNLRASRLDLRASRLNLRGLKLHVNAFRLSCSNS